MTVDHGRKDLTEVKVQDSLELFESGIARHRREGILPYSSSYVKVCICLGYVNSLLPRNLRKLLEKGMTSGRTIIREVIRENIKNRQLGFIFAENSLPIETY